MTLTTQRKALLAALGLAALGVVLDQAFLQSAVPSPAAASAQGGTAADSANASPAPQTSAPSGGAGEGEGLRVAARALEGLRDIAADGAERDAFAPGGKWLAPAEAPITAAQPVASFEAGRRLTAVLLSQANPGAIVNGRFVRVGGEIDGFTLLRVSEREAVFQRGDLLATLRLATQAEEEAGVQ